MDEQVTLIWDGLRESVASMGINFFLGIVVLVLGWWLINKLAKIFDAFVEKKEKESPSDPDAKPISVSVKNGKASVDISFRLVFKAIFKVTLRVLLIIGVIQIIGMEMVTLLTGMILLVAVIGFIIQGSLSNLVGGFMIRTLKSTRVGEHVSVNNHEGIVTKITLFYTHLQTEEEDVILIPNGVFANSSIKKISKGEIRELNINPEQSTDETKNVSKF